MSRRRTSLALAAISPLIGVPLVVVGGTAQAEWACSLYSASAAADGVRVAFQGDNVLPLTNTAEAVGPGAASLVTSGASSAYAGAPYPGDAALSAVSLVGGVVHDNGGPGGIDANTYPLMAQAQYPTRPHGAVNQAPVLTLQADARAFESTATATSGGADATGTGSTVGGSIATTTTSCNGTTGAKADADTDTQALNLVAGTLRIGRVHSEAHVLISPDGTTTLRYGLQLGQVTVAGQTVQIEESGANAGGNVIPLSNPAADVLAGQGITLRWVAPQKDADGHGVTAPGLEISVRAKLNEPPAPVPPQGTTPSKVTYTFGRANARAEATFADDSSEDSGTGSPGGSTGVPGDGAVSGPVDGGTGGFTGSSGGPATSDGGPPDVAAEQGGAQASPGMRQLGSPLLPTDWRAAYLALVLGSVALLGGGIVLRHLVERLEWM